MLNQNEMHIEFDKTTINEDLMAANDLNKSRWIAVNDGLHKPSRRMKNE